MVGNMLVSKVGRVGLVGSCWEGIGLNWEAVLLPASHWSPNQTLTLEIHPMLRSFRTSLTSNWEWINVKLIDDSRQWRTIIAMLPLCVLWTVSVSPKLR